MHRFFLAVSILGFIFLAAAKAAPLIPVGAARVDISPTRAVPLMGYAARANLPAPTQVAARIYARALAIGADSEVAIVLTIDNCILPGAVTEEVRRRIAQKVKVPAERIALTVTHTHSAPCLSGAAPNIFGVEIAAADQAAIDAYTRSLTDRLEEAALAAMNDRKPSEIAWGKGAAGFAKNRRTANGPVDHEMPLLCVRSPEGHVRAVFVSYACHCTTLGGEFNAVHGDWAGLAASTFEGEHPDAVALVAIGCGADANPDPRGTVDFAVQHGEEIAHEADRLLKIPLTPLTSAPRCRLKVVQLPFQAPFTRAEWEQRATTPGIVGYHARKWLARLDRGETVPATLPYPVQTWTFGDQLALVFLGGEVVVDYSLRLKTELDTNRLWINAYANDVPCYIPSRRVLSEGGYEPELSLWYYDRPQRLAPEIEDLIVATVHELLPKSFVVDPKQAENPPPTTATAALASFRPRPGFEIELVAGEPLIESPVAIDFAPDGRLWVCEMRDYPSGMDGKGQPGGCIKLLRDLDGDGRYDTAEIWADDLPFPTGLMAWHDGVIVCAAPDIWFLSPSKPIRTAPDRAPTKREKLLSGFVTENFQARVNGLRWGLDGWVYGSGGLFGGKITVHKTGQTIDCSNRDFRFKPETGEFEPLAGVSQQGHVRDDFAQWFGNDNSTLLWHFPLDDRYRRRNPHVVAPPPRVILSRDADSSRVFPASRTLARFNSPESANRITSGCGPEIYRDDLLGSSFAGNAFVCEPVHNLIRRAVLASDGATFSARRADDEQNVEFLASTDNWFRPVEVRTGPDGALWIVDMYRFVIEHPRWIPVDRLKELDVRAGADKGRIWRLFSSGNRPRPIRNLTQLSARELVSVIESVNGVERDLAHQLLLNSGPAGREGATISELVRIAGQSARPASRVQALAALHDLGRIDRPALLGALRDRDPRVRRFAVALCEPLGGDSGQPLLDALPELVNDPDPGVRYQVALSLGEFPKDAAGTALADLAIRDGASEWHRAAIFSALLGSPEAFVRRAATLHHDATLEPVWKTIPTILASAGAIDALATWIAGMFPPEEKISDSTKLTEGLQLLAALSAHPKAAEALSVDGHSPAARSLTRLQGELGNSAAGLAADSASSESTRIAATQLLAESARTKRARRLELIAMLDLDLPPSIHRALIAGLRRQESDDVASTLLQSWSRRSPAQRLTLLPLLLTRDNWVDELLAAAEHGDLAPAEFSPAQRQQLRQHSNAALRQRAEKLFPTTSSDRAGVIARYANVANLSGSASRGATYFDQRCSSCHQLRGHGHAVGPNLADFRAKPVADFLVAILDPDAAVEPRYVAWTAELAGGRVLLGVARDESSTALTLVQPGGVSESVRRAEITRLTANAGSLMPVGLEQDLSAQDLADLIAWIKTVPASFGSASPQEAALAKKQFRAAAPAKLSKLASTHDALRYRSWLRPQPLFYCRQTNGQSRVKWEAIPCETEPSGARRFRFPAAMGYGSQPSGSFTLCMQGHKQVDFDVALDDAEWSSDDGRVRVHYVTRESNVEDSCGVFEVEADASVLPGTTPVLFEVSGSASNSERWFGIYQVQ